MAGEDAALADVMNLLQTESEPSSGPAGGVVPTTAPRPGIPALREQLQVKRLSDKEVERYTKRYETYVGSKTTDSLIDNFIFLATKAVAMTVKIKDIDAYQKELRNDYILNKEFSNLAGNLALKCGQILAPANAALITTKHIDFSPQLPEQIHPSRDENGYPLEGVDEVPGSATAE